MAIDWTRGYTLRMRFLRVDPRTWADSEEVSRVESVTIQRTTGSATQLPCTASIDLKTSPAERFPSGWYRVVAIVRQGRDRERVDLATVWCETTGGRLERGMNSDSVKGRSSLWPCSRCSIPIGSYVPAGYDCARWAADLLRSRTPAPVVLADGASFALGVHYVPDVGEMALGVGLDVLGLGGRTVRERGDGANVVCAEPSDPSLVLDRMGVRMLTPTISGTLDLSEIPNRYVVRYGGDEYVATNDDPASETSTSRRGFVVEKLDTTPKPLDGESLQSYAERRLEEESSVTDERTYARKWWPDVMPGDIVRGSLASMGLDGDFRVKSQQVTCGEGGIVVEERVNREVRTWRRD